MRQVRFVVLFVVLFAASYKYKEKETKNHPLTCRVGDVLAQRALAVGIQGVEWKRKVGQRYHGRIAALLTSMQESGVKLV